MIWWWRARSLTAVGLAFAGSLITAVVAGSQVLPLPSLVGSLVVPIVFALLLPLVPIVVWLYGVDRSSGDLDADAVRPVAAWDLCVPVVMLLVIVVAVGVTSAGGWWELGRGYLRNLVGCLGLALIVLPLVGARLAALAPIGAVIISALFGSGYGGMTRWWAWPIADAHAGLAFAEAALLLIVGFGLAVWRLSGPFRPIRIRFWP